MIKKTALILSLVIYSLYSSAHTMWIQPENCHTQINQSQKIRIYFGEMSDDKRTSPLKWFSDISTFRMYITYPDGEKSEITSEKDSISYYWLFTPQTDGT